MVFLSCVNLKQSTVFEQPLPKNTQANIKGFYALDILPDGLNSEVWFTEKKSCIDINNETQTKFSGSKGLHLVWDKNAGGCDWVGMGIGWDAWTGKNLHPIINDAAIQIKAYSRVGQIKSLPLAVSLEDFGGKQAWSGMYPKNIKYLNNDSWATITMPLSEFSWDEFEADASNIKQMIIQFEAGGDVYFDAIKIVPHVGASSQKLNMTVDKSFNPSINGICAPGEWTNSNKIAVGYDTIQLKFTENNLFISGQIADETPMQNGKTGSELWNGDGIEFAIGTNPNAPINRKTLLLSDKHFVIKSSDKPVMWDYRNNKELPAEIKMSKSSNGYTFEVKIDLKYLELSSIEYNTPYKLELAVNKGTITTRQEQFRWNSSFREGFHLNPSLWGELIFTK